MIEREFFRNGRYFMANVIAVDGEDVLAVDAKGDVFVATPSLGHMKRTLDSANGRPWQFFGHSADKPNT